MGTEKYPEEESYSQFLAEKGGDSNAYTTDESTNYQFQLVVPKSAQSGLPSNGEAGDHPLPCESPLYEALDRFSQFFIAPLFTESATERELNAVDSEHNKNVQNDGNRFFQLGQSRANPEHPFSKFGTGSKATLWDEPQERGIDTRARLIEAYQKWYSANLMTLCISGPHSLDLMQKWAVELFTPIKNKNVTFPSAQYKTVSPLNAEHMGRVLYVVPIKDLRLLSLSWLIPETRSAYRCKPSNYVSHLLGHEGKGSLLSLLKERNLVDGLAAWQSVSAEDFGVFDVSIELTKEGIDHVDEIVDMVFGYIHLVQKSGVQNWIHEESAALADMAFRFAERQEPFSFVRRISAQMATYPPEEYLSGAYLSQEYNPDMVRTVLNCLTPDRVNLLVAGSFVAGTTDSTEKWYGTAYRIEKISKAKVDRWRSTEPDPGLHLPAVNPFIPKDFTLIAGPTTSPGSNKSSAASTARDEADSAGPSKILDDDSFELYYKLDRTFGRPKVNVKISFLTPVAYASPRNFVLCSMFTSLLQDDLNEFSYDADLAGLGYHLRAVDHGVQLSVSGYNDRLLVLASAILKKMAAFRANPERFSMIFDQWERHWANWDKEQPYQHAMFELSHMLISPKWHVFDFLACMRDQGCVTVDTVNAFVKELLSRMRCVVLVHGNVSEQWARDLVSSIQAELDFQPLARVEWPARRVAQLPTDCQIVTRKAGTNKEDLNSAVHMSFQVGPRGTYRTDVILELVAEIMNKPAFHELRTKQQLGYMVFSGVDSCENVRGLYFIIQSTVADPDELCRRIDDFLLHFRSETLANISDAEFAGFVDSAVALKEEKDKAMAQRSQRFFNEIVDRTFVFDRSVKEIAALRGLSKDDVVSFFDNFFAVGGSGRRKVASLVYGVEHEMRPEAKELDETKGQLSVKVVTDPTAFLLSRPMYPASGCHSPFAESS